MDAINEDTMKQYFNLLENTLKEHNLLDSPSQLYNVDETGMPLDPKAPNIVTKRGVKKVRYRSSGKKGQVTIVACGNAAGQVIPPLVIFDTKNFNHAWTVNEVSGTKYGLSEKGWITTELFQSWLTEYFLEYAVSKRPLFLLLDGHSTHYQPDLIRYARINDVVMLCLPPHTTHETQPLDTGIFKPLKTQLHTEESRSGNNKIHLQLPLSQAWLLAVTPANVMAGFKTSGVYPLNRSAVKTPPSTASSSAKDSTEEDENQKSGESSDSKANFSTEQEELFQKRFAEGYDIYTDDDYIHWLHINHPESLHSSDNPENSSDVSALISDHFSSVTVETPISVSKDASYYFSSF